MSLSVSQMVVETFWPTLFWLLLQFIEVWGHVFWHSSVKVSWAAVWTMVESETLKNLYLFLFVSSSVVDVLHCFGWLSRCLTQFRSNWLHHFRSKILLVYRGVQQSVHILLLQYKSLTKMFGASFFIKTDDAVHVDQTSLLWARASNGHRCRNLVVCSNAVLQTCFSFLVK